MKKRSENTPLLLITLGLTVLMTALPAFSATVAYWRFEAGPANTNVSHGAANGVYSPDIADVSGSGNHLSVWSTGGSAGYAYRADVGGSPVPRTGQSNQFSVKNTGSLPAMWCSTTAMRTISPAAFTIEATFKLENGSYRTIVGRDSYGAASENAQLAALYFQAVPNNALAIKFCDVSGYWHQAVSTAYIFTGFNYSSNPNGIGVPWYSIAGVSDGSTLSLYLLEHGSGIGYQLAAQTNLAVSGSPNTALSAGADHPDGRSDWEPGDWSVGRGLYNAGHTDRAYGFIDEVRISDTALQPSEFLFYEHIPAGVAVSPENLTLHEEGATGGDLFFSLEYEPAGTVVLVIAEQQGRGQVTLSQTTLTFTPDNWDGPQVVHVTAVDDADLENAEHPVPLSITVSSTQDPVYDGLAVEPAIVIIADNECGAWGYAAGDYTIDCVVNLHDFAQFALGWMDCSFPNQPDCTNFNE